MLEDLAPTVLEEPPRPHKKRSPNACAACRRGHVRCDKRLPVCRNCITHDCECDYVMKPRKGAKKSRPLQQETRSDSDTTLASVSSDDTVVGASPIAKVTGKGSRNAVGPVVVVAPNYHVLPPTQQRLLYHMSSIAQSIEAGRASNLVIYLKKLPILLRVASSYDFVMHSLLAWASSHLAFATNSSDALLISRQYRLLSMQGLQKALKLFNEKNMDAVFSASLLLGWQAANPREWAILNKGTSQVVTAMHPWRSQSLFAEYLIEDDLYQASPSAVYKPVNFLTDTDETAALRYIQDALQRVEMYASGRKEELLILRNLMAFVDNVAKHLPIEAPALRFRLLEPTRSMLYWYPTQLAGRARSDPVAMVVLAHLYAISLTVQPVFAGSGAAHFRGLSTAPIDEIYRILMEMHQAKGGAMESFVPLSLMHFPMQAVSLFRNRMGLDQGVFHADQTLTAIQYGLDPLVDSVNAVTLDE